jgi:class 3 adenylate cyclase
MPSSKASTECGLTVGVATGEAVAAAGTADQFMVTGEVANLAARLQSAAEGVGVVVSEDRAVRRRPRKSTHGLAGADSPSARRRSAAMAARAGRTCPEP